MIILRLTPLLLFVVIFYFFMMGSGAGDQEVYITFLVPSGSEVSLTNGELVIALGLLMLFLELLKSTRTGTPTIIDHMLSIGVFVLCLILFMSFSWAATGTFLLITLMTLIDVVAGFTITIFGARRDITFDQGFPHQP